MSLLKIQKLIDSGEKMIYRNQVAVFKSFSNRIGSIEILIELDGKKSCFTKNNEAQIELWLANFSPADPEKSHEIAVPEKQEVHEARLPVKSIQHHVPALYSENKEALQNLSKQLMEDIEKVRKDPGYVHQAKQICNSVNAIVNITKLQLQLIKIED